MRYHVPFAHRNRTPGPIFIGFDEPVSIQKRKGRFNWCGFTGLLLALVSPLTLFLIAPVALLFSLIGMRRAPRGMAFFGLLLSGAATTILSLCLVSTAKHRHIRYEDSRSEMVAFQQRGNIQQTQALMEEVQDELRAYRASHSNQLPDLSDGMDMTVMYEDAWDKPFRYGVSDEGCTVRSAGPDREFDTPDDLTVRLDGITTDWVAGLGSDAE